MIVVSDTSPVSNLILINRLDILQKLFVEVIVPTAVDGEILALQKLGHDITTYQSADWINVSRPANTEKVRSLQLKLDEGEAQAIVPALEIHCDLLLMDERIGTNVARNEGLQTLGLVGVLIKAKEEHVIDAVGPILTDLRSVGFWLGNSLEEKILQDQDEN